MAANITYQPAVMPQCIEPAFENPEGVLALFDSGAPYKSIAAAQKEPVGTRPTPWYRNFWALGGKVLFPGAEAYFHNQHFVAASRDVFHASVIQPVAMMTNLNPPAPSSDPHLDLPFFRGAHRREVPLWMLAPMGYSGLFGRWAIPVSSVLTWFYRGRGGEFEYWPNGLLAPSRMQAGQADNCAIIGDNESMYHRVCEIGSTEQFLPDNVVPYRSTLNLQDDEWVIHKSEISTSANVLSRFKRQDMRLSLLWKAFCFDSDAQAELAANGRDNLNPGLIVEIFQRDLRFRGVMIDDPNDLDGRSDWAQTVQKTYSPEPGAG